MILEQERHLLGVDLPRGLVCRLALLAALLAAIVNCGDLGSIDSRRRLQQARALWAGEPEVRPEDPAPFFPRSSDGVRRSIYSAGQAILFLPADIAASSVTSLVADPHVADGARIVLVAWVTQSFVTAWALLFAYLLLRRLRFDHTPALLGTLSLPLATTFLHYVQVVQENNLMLAAGLSATFFIASWLDSGHRRDALLAGAFSGFAYLTRPTCLADTAGGLVFLALAGIPGRKRLAQFAAWFSAGFAIFAFFERWYFASRFGSWTGTVLGAIAPHTGFTNPFWAGVRTALFSDLSLFLFDPLLVLTLVLLAARWPLVSSRIPAFAVGAMLTLVIDIAFYARFFTPTGQSAWGDRFTQTPVHLLCLLALPLLWTHWHTLRTPARYAAAAVIAWGFIHQIASVSLNMSVEVEQAARFPGIWRIPQRFANLWIVLRGNASTSLLLSFLPPEWQRLNLLPFQLTLRFPVLASYAVAAWTTAVAATAVLYARLLSSTSPAGTSASAVPRRTAAIPPPSADADDAPGASDKHFRR